MNIAKKTTMCMAMTFMSLAFISQSAAIECKTALEQLNESRSSGDIAKISAAIHTFKTEADCSDSSVNVALTQTAAVLAQQAQAAIEAGELETAETLLSIAPATHWLVQVSRADIAAKRDNRAEAAELYNASLDTILDPALTPNSDKLSSFAKQIAMLAQENTMLAGSTANTISRSDGRATGVYGALSRGLSFVPSKEATIAYNPPVDKVIYDSRPVKSTYIPIKFATNSDQLDHAGKQEALKLAKFINSYHIKLIHLVGHTDERGSHEFNQDLSVRRAHNLKLFLQKNGHVVAKIITSGRGEKEPPTLSDYSIYNIEQRQAIARRVEMALK